MLEVKKLEKQILIQYSQMKTIIDSASFIMYLKNIDGTILLANKELAELSGISIHKISGINADTFFKTSEIIKKEDKQVIETRKTITFQRLIEMQDGTSSWFKIIKTPVLDDVGNVVSIVVILQNIDAEKDLEDRKNTFIATLTHDLKTPTIAQIKALDLLTDNIVGPLNVEQIDIIEQIKSSCNYMSDLILTILDTYLFDSGQTKINYEEFDIIELIKETSHEISNLSDEREQNIVLNSELTSNLIMADRFQLKRVIINLLTNAITYGYRQSDVEISLKEENSDIELNIKNKSAYITKDQLTDIFEKFKTTANTKFKKTGTGLGLYLAKQIINAHKGKVHLQVILTKLAVLVL
ncbi:MAG: ATP-binding protein [Candidatus Gastranaerophilaceae bacterium]